MTVTAAPATVTVRRSHHDTVMLADPETRLNLSPVGRRQCSQASRPRPGGGPGPARDRGSGRQGRGTGRSSRVRARPRAPCLPVSVAAVTREYDALRPGPGPPGRLSPRPLAAHGTSHCTVARWGPAAAQCRGPGQAPWGYLFMSMDI